MERDAGDILDKYSIARLKVERIGSDENKGELAIFEQGFLEVKQKYPQYDWEQIGGLLYKINGLMWETEATLRKGQIDNDITKVAEVSIRTRRLNNIRIALKNFVNKLTGIGFQDAKKDHVSE